MRLCHSLFFFFNDTATTEIYTLSLHDALPISHLSKPGSEDRARSPHVALRTDPPGRPAFHHGLPGHRQAPDAAHGRPAEGRDEPARASAPRTRRQERPPPNGAAALHTPRRGLHPRALKGRRRATPVTVSQS